MRSKPPFNANGSKVGVRIVVATIVIILLGIWLYAAFSDPVISEASRNSTEALVARITGTDECINQPELDASIDAPSLALYQVDEPEHEWLLHHMNANCVIVEAALPYVTDQLLIVHDDPLIYDWGQWDTFYYRLSEKGDHFVTITASGPGGTTVLEGPIDSLLADGGS